MNASLYEKSVGVLCTTLSVRVFHMNVNFIIVNIVHQSLFKVFLACLIQRKSLSDNKVHRSGLLASAGVRQNDFLS